MAYTKNHTSWLVTDPITNTVLNNFETIYTELVAYLLSHNHNDIYYTKAQMQSRYFYNSNDGAGSGLDADLLYYSGGNKHAADFAGMGVPTGLIILWYGSEASIPSGWKKCDGNNGTINLVDMIPIGAGVADEYGTYKNPGTTGGNINFTVTGDLTINGHALTIAEMPSHRHTWDDNCGSYSSGAAGETAMIGSTSRSLNTGKTGLGYEHTHTGSITGNSVSSMPYYYSLFYIQKV